MEEFLSRFGTFLPPVIAFIGGLILVQAWKTVWEPSKSSANWLKVRGEISGSGVEVRSGGGDETSRPRVTYRYELNGTKYLGNKLFFGDWLHTPFRKLSERAISKYSPGMRVTIFVNESNPKQSVLEPGVRLETHLIMLIGPIVFLAAFIVFFLVVVKA